MRLFQVKPDLAGGLHHAVRRQSGGLEEPTAQGQITTSHGGVVVQVANELGSAGFHHPGGLGSHLRGLHGSSAAGFRQLGGILGGRRVLGDGNVVGHFADFGLQGADALGHITQSGFQLVHLKSLLWGEFSCFNHRQKRL